MKLRFIMVNSVITNHVHTIKGNYLTQLQNFKFYTTKVDEKFYT